MEHGRAPLIWNPDINKGMSLVSICTVAVTHYELGAIRSHK